MRRLLGVAAALGLASGAVAAGDEALRQAAEALARNDFASAIPFLEAALGEDPENVNARFNLAYACQSTGDDDAAIRHYRQVVDEQPELLAARQNLATLLLRAGDFADAASELEAIAAAQPGDIKALLAAAAAHRRAGSAEEAAQAYGRVLEADESSAEALLGLASSLEMAGRIHEAVPYYLRAVAIDPAVESEIPAVAQRLEQAGAAQDALELYRRYARNRPDDAAVQQEIGILLLEDGNVRAAVNALERAVGLEPQAARHSALAEAYRQAGQADAAREQLRLAAEIAPQDAAARVRYANSLLQESAFEAAVAQYLAACQADPGSRDAWNGLAFAAFQLGNFQGALQALAQSERLGPPQAASVYLKALALDRLQAFEQAREAYRAFLALDPAMADEVWKAEQRLLTIDKILAKR